MGGQEEENWKLADSRHYQKLKSQLEAEKLLKMSSSSELKEYLRSLFQIEWWIRNGFKKICIRSIGLAEGRRQFQGHYNNHGQWSCIQVCDRSDGGVCTGEGSRHRRWP